MLRVLIGLGVLLMAVGFGAAGWQYWKGLPSAAPATDVAEAEASAVGAPASQNWLISPSGSLVPRADVRAYLVQDRLVPDRMLTMVQTAPLSALLVEGEMLPDAAYLEVFADIRAPRIAQPLCPVLTAGPAAACALHSARVIEDSVDPARGTARFRIELAFRLKPAAEPVPDLAAHVLRTEGIGSAFAAPVGEEDAEATEVPPPASAAEALAAALSTAEAACADPARAVACRLMRLTVDWEPGQPAAYRAEVGWLTPLPEGMFPAPPLDAVPEG